MRARARVRVCVRTLHRDEAALVVIKQLSLLVALESRPVAVDRDHATLAVPLSTHTHIVFNNFLIDF
jgi:hypothetical protein